MSVLDIPINANPTPTHIRRACLFFSDYYTMTAILTGNAKQPIVILCPTNPPSEAPTEL